MHRQCSSDRFKEPGGISEELSISEVSCELKRAGVYRFGRANGEQKHKDILQKNEEIMDLKFGHCIHKN
jgi:hypothetical protein